MSCAKYIKLEQTSHTLKKSRMALVCKQCQFLSLEGPLISCFNKDSLRVLSNDRDCEYQVLLEANLKMFFYH